MWQGKSNSKEKKPAACSSKSPVKKKPNDHEGPQGNIILVRVVV